MANDSHPHLSAGERLRRAGIGAWSIIGLLILAAVSGWLLLRIRVVIPPLVLALLIIYILNPPITWLSRRGVPRALAAIACYVVILGGVVLAGMAAAPYLSRQIDTFSRQWPAFRNQLVTFTEDTAATIESRVGIEIDTSQVACLLGDRARVEGQDCDRVTERIREQVVGGAGRITEIGVTVLEAALVFIIAPLLALYLLIDLPQVQRDMLNLVPAHHREEAADLASKVGRAVGGFFRGQLLVALTVGVLSAAGFRIIGLPFWLVIGAIAGFFNLVPLIGPWIGGALGFLVGTVSGGIGLGLKAALVEAIVQQLDNHIVSPQVMKRAVQLHPASVVLALLAGATIAGFWGILLAVPAVAVAKILLGHVWMTRVLGEHPTPYAEAEASGRGPPPQLPAKPVTGEPAEAEVPGEEPALPRRDP